MEALPSVFEVGDWASTRTVPGSSSVSTTVLRGTCHGFPVLEGLGFRGLGFRGASNKLKSCEEAEASVSDLRHVPQSAHVRFVGGAPPPPTA